MLNNLKCLLQLPTMPKTKTYSLSIQDLATENSMAVATAGCWFILCPSALHQIGVLEVDGTTRCVHTPYNPHEPTLEHFRTPIFLCSNRCPSEMTQALFGSSQGNTQKDFEGMMRKMQSLERSFIPQSIIIHTTVVLHCKCKHTNDAHNMVAWCVCCFRT